MGYVLLCFRRPNSKAIFNWPPSPLIAVVWLLCTAFAQFDVSLIPIHVALSHKQLDDNDVILLLLLLGWLIDCSGRRRRHFVIVVLFDCSGRRRRHFVVIAVRVIALRICLNRSLAFDHCIWLAAVAQPFSLLHSSLSSLFTGPWFRGRIWASCYRWVAICCFFPGRPFTLSCNRYTIDLETLWLLFALLLPQLCYFSLRGSFILRSNPFTPNNQP